MQETAWQYGGSDELFPNLTWETRPNMAGSEASEDLQRAWVATITAIQVLLGAVKNGNCFLVAMTAGPLVEHVLGEPVQPCAGYAGFVERTGRSEYGMRWRPEKWAAGNQKDDRQIGNSVPIVTHNATAPLAGKCIEATQLGYCKCAFSSAAAVNSQTVKCSTKR